MRRIRVGLALLLLSQFALQPARAGVNPSFNWSVTYPSYNVTTSQAQALAQKFDLMEVEPGNETMIPLVRAINPNFIFLRYDNITNNNRGGHKDKWNAMQNYCVANGQDFEKMWLHFSQDTWITLGSADPDDDKLGGTLGTGCVVFASNNYNDRSYEARGTDPNMNFTFCGGAGQAVYLGHFDRFATLDWNLRTAGAGLGATWEYFRSDSTWQPLTVTDSTFNMTRSGRVKFTPPTDWGYLSVAGFRNYWVRLRCTATPTAAPAWAWVRRVKYIWKNGSGQYRIPGWNPANDANGDGWVSDAEFTAPSHDNNASSRLKTEARVPTFYMIPERYVAHVGDALYRQLSADWQVSWLQKDWGNGQRGSGIFEDNCIPQDGSITVQGGSINLADSIIVGLYTPVSGSAVLEYPGPGPGRRFSQDHLRADSTAYSRIRSMGKLLEGNASQFYCDFGLYNYDPKSVLTITRGDSGGYFANSVHSGVQRELFCVPKNSVHGCGLEGPSVCVEAQFQIAKQATSNGRFCEFLFRASFEASDYAANGFTLERDKEYSLAYFCMVNNPNAYFGWMPVGKSSPPESTQWWPAAGYNLGTPVNDTVYVFGSGTDSNGEPYKVYARYYTGGVALVKPKYQWSSAFSDAQSPVTVVNLPVPLRRLAMDGTLGAPTTQITLKNIEGAILVGSISPQSGGGTVGGGGGGPDVTPPAAVASLSHTFVALSVSPANQGLATLSTTIKADLSEYVDPLSVNAGTFNVVGSKSGSHPGTVSALGRYLTFKPLVAFQTDEVVTVTLSANLKSTTGHFLDGDGDGSPGGNKVWSFTVGKY